MPHLNRAMRTNKEMSSQVNTGMIVGPDGVMPTQEFSEAWDQIYPKCPWKDNGWVSVTTFKRVEKP
jgi:hypothetical protein